jgi:hypothetical protein
MPSKRAATKQHVVYHADGSVWAKGPKIDDTMTGSGEWFRKDGTKLRSRFFDNGKQVGRWTTYDKKATSTSHGDEACMSTSFGGFSVRFGEPGRELEAAPCYGTIDTSC